MSEINLSLRFYKYIKATSITSIETAIVELITNCIDAYNRVNTTKREIDVEINYNERSLIIYDQASGLSPDKLEECFGQVGNYTSSIGSRGFFSKGAKDCSSLGDMNFVSIKDNVISECTLTNHNLFSITNHGRGVLPEDRDKYNIVENGLYIKINLLSSVTMTTITNSDKFIKYYSLRDIMKNTDNCINLKVIEQNSDVYINKRVQYDVEVEEKNLYEETFIVPGFEDKNITAKFCIMKKTDRDKKDELSYMEHGILIKDDMAIYDLTTFYNDIRAHPKIYEIYGYIKTDGINMLMHEFDNDLINERNPFPILDPSRIGSINKNHPFIKALYGRPHKILKFILDDLYEKEFNNTDIYDISHMFDTLDAFDDEFYKTLQGMFIPSNGNVLKKIAKYVEKTEKNVIEKNEKSEYISDDIKTAFDELNNSEYNKTIPKFNLQFMHNEEEFLCRIFISKSNVNVHINCNDGHLDKYVSHINNVIKITNKEMFISAIVEIMISSFSMELIKYKLIGNSYSGDNSSVVITEINSNLFEYRKLFASRFHTYLIKNNILNF